MTRLENCSISYCMKKKGHKGRHTSIPKHQPKFRNPKPLTKKNYIRRWTEFKREGFRLTDNMIISGVRETKVSFINGFDLILRDRKRKR